MYKYLTTAMNPTQNYLQVSKSYKISTNPERSTGFLIPAHHSNQLYQIMFLKRKEQLFCMVQSLINLRAKKKVHVWYSKYSIQLFLQQPLLQIICWSLFANHQGSEF